MQLFYTFLFKNEFCWSLKSAGKMIVLYWLYEKALSENTVRFLLFVPKRALQTHLFTVAKLAKVREWIKNKLNKFPK